MSTKLTPASTTSTVYMAEEMGTKPKTGTRARRGTSDSLSRKRELDRIAQRMSRERSKNRILYLEEKLKSLEARDRDGQISSLMSTIEDLRRQNTQLKALLLKMKSLADTVNDLDSTLPIPQCRAERNESTSSRSPSDRGSISATTAVFQDDHESTEVIVERHDGASDIQDSASIESVHQPTQSMVLANCSPNQLNSVFHNANLAEHLPEYDIDMLTQLATFDATVASWNQPTFDWDFTNPSCKLSVAPPEEKWVISDTAFLHALSLTKAVTRVDVTLDPDVPVKAILWGWHTVEASQRNHPVWVALRQVDERVFGNWTRKAQKVAMMYVCQLLMQYRAYPSQENLERVPSFLRPRPSQERIEHPLVIDFLIWPGLRDHLVFTHQSYSQNAEFSQRFCEDLRFHWPFPDIDIFTFDSQKLTHVFSEKFQRYARDLKNWTMESRFFETFEELSHNIPASYDRESGMPFAAMPYEQVV